MLANKFPSNGAAQQFRGLVIVVAKLRALPRARRRDAHKIPIAPLSGGGARKSPTTETGVDTKAASTK